MKEDFRYRHELKYEIDQYQLEILRMRLAPIMEPDKHTDKSGSYVVRSVYFDDPMNSNYYDNEDGNNNRQKFRIRTYNRSDAVIRLEIKHKKNGLTLKESCNLDKETAQSLIRNNEIEWSDEYSPVLKKLYVYRRISALSPKVIVEYDRTPFVYRDANVRVTLDQNIRASNDSAAFFENRLAFRPIMPMGFHILEVKYDQFLPDHIYKSISSLGLKRVTFSKYYYSRKIGGLV